MSSWFDDDCCFILSSSPVRDIKAPFSSTCIIEGTIRKKFSFEFLNGRFISRLVAGSTDFGRFYFYLHYLYYLALFIYFHYLHYLVVCCCSDEIENSIIMSRMQSSNINKNENTASESAHTHNQRCDPLLLIFKHNPKAGTYTWYLVPGTLVRHAPL